MNERLVALDFISTCLRVQRTHENTASLDRKIGSQSLDWRSVIGLANTNFISPTIWTEMVGRGLVCKAPSDVRDYLDEVHRLNTMRNRYLRQQTLEAVRMINRIAVEPLLLKGAISLFVRMYEDPGARVLTDIDILVPHHKAEECWNLLCTIGYSPIETDFDFSRHHHLRPLRRAGEYATIEIHRYALPIVSSGRLFGAHLTRTDIERMTHSMCETAETISEQGVSMSVPAPTFRTLHCLLHSALAENNAYRAGILPLRSLHELALMQSVFGDDIDWGVISQLLSSGGKLNLLNAWVYLADRLFGCSLPAGWGVTPRMVAHYARCRLQARWGLSITLQTISRM